jgi:LmbE family N-acetylglucosaminyl deacetylase
VGAHPDDVEFGCAPILIKEARAGHEVRILVTSKGEAASAGTPEERAEEARSAANIIGASIDFLDLGGDCNIAYTPANALPLARAIREFRPDAVLAPHLGENQHPDHAAVGKLTRDAARYARYGGISQLSSLPSHPIASLYFYAVTQVYVDPPSIVVNVSSVFAEWQTAMQCHASQMKTRAYPELVNARARAWGAAIGVDYAVGLWPNDPVHVSSLADILSSRYF